MAFFIKFGEEVFGRASTEYLGERELDFDSI
jgi:hypothetical protein